jgi:hypothetical protein
LAPQPPSVGGGEALTAACRVPNNSKFDGISGGGQAGHDLNSIVIEALNAQRGDLLANSGFYLSQRYIDEISSTESGRLSSA